ncbi:MAG TPA: hypothetical protein VEZ48_11110 [Sphingomonadaceae bacterium]|nr:hypothetical protein [Sphingomonadaceae bacterium]
MIVQSFRSVLWVGAVAGAAISCYMVSLRVAAERASLERVETRILLAKRDIRALDTELTTRGRLRQLERWNSDVLALTAPTEGQFLEGEVQLASLGRVESKALGTDGGTGAIDEGERFMHAVAAPPPAADRPTVMADYSPVRTETRTDSRLVRASVSDAAPEPRERDERPKVKPTAKPTAKPKAARSGDDAAAPKPAAKTPKRQTAAVADKKAKAKTTT